jgi:exodeoxyribonuclease V gamma subunit
MERLLDDSEPQEIEGIPKYQLQQELLAHAIRGEPLDPILPVLRARGELPPGHAGDAELREIREVAEHFAGLVRQHVNDTADDPRSVQLRLGQFELSARLDRLHDGRLVRYRLTTRKPKDLLASWIDHLVANCESETESVLITTDKDGKPVVEKFLPLETESANRHLTDLLEHYWRGLTQPLPLFPRTSLAYVDQMLRPRGKRSPIEVARAKWKHPPETWEPDKGERPESEDPYFQVAFRHVADPLDETWEKLALAVFVPPVKAVRP